MPPFRADHVGSLLRPAALKQAFRGHGAGRMDDKTFAAIQDEAIRGAVKLQEEIGLLAVNDGEFRRGSYWGRFVQRLSGLTIGAARYKFRDDSGPRATSPRPSPRRRSGAPCRSPPTKSPSSPR